MAKPTEPLDLYVLDPGWFKRRRDVRVFLESELYRGLQYAVGAALDPDGPVNERLAKDAGAAAYFLHEDLGTLTAAFLERPFPRFRRAEGWFARARLEWLEKLFACAAACAREDDELTLLLTSLIDAAREGVRDEVREAAAARRTGAPQQAA